MVKPRNEITPAGHLFWSDTPVEWQISAAPVAYPEAVRCMEARVEAISTGAAAELIWLLEHPSLFTAGTSAQDSDLLAAERFPVFKSGRGGQYTYHGPGQRIAYVMLDLKRRRCDVRAFVTALEDWLIATCARFNITAERRSERIGVWVARPELGAGREDKIAALGIRLKRWVSLHGISLNVDPELEHFSGIVPCGIDATQFGVTSFTDLGLPVTMHDVDIALRGEFETIFGPTTDQIVGRTSNSVPG